jgi:hypothetical protein
MFTKLFLMFSICLQIANSRLRGYEGPITYQARQPIMTSVTVTENIPYEPYSVYTVNNTRPLTYTTHLLA